MLGAEVGVHADDLEDVEQVSRELGRDDDRVALAGVVLLRPLEQLQRTGEWLDHAVLAQLADEVIGPGATVVLRGLTAPGH